jgi:hypothetical protein
LPQTDDAKGGADDVPISVHDIYFTLFPLCEWIRWKSRHSDERVAIGIVGAGASGKVSDPVSP